ncbi:GTPase ERA-like, chloroplastic [Hevea brasiliensis]|uniref:GTPase ERA-like, chloroplastic n=1 Tax=Hevea brasiliensis TaxID=3981 RepID=UPI0025E8C78C|nr:GTPase ERA-like, chloroplastic [Hevea brasiliensis]
MGMEPLATTLKKQASMMELALYLSPLQYHTISPFCYSYSRDLFTRSNQFRFQAKISNSTRDKNLIFSMSKKQQQQLWISEPEFDDDYYLKEEEEEEEEEEESNIFSLSEKPERNMALLDDYEMEELDYASDPNHRSRRLSENRMTGYGESGIGRRAKGLKKSISPWRKAKARMLA